MILKHTHRFDGITGVRIVCTVGAKVESRNLIGKTSFQILVSFLRKMSETIKKKSSNIKNIIVKNI